MVKRMMMLLAVAMMMAAMMAVTPSPAMATSDRSSLAEHIPDEFLGGGTCVIHRGGNSDKGQFFTGGFAQKNPDTSC